MASHDKQAVQIDLTQLPIGDLDQLNQKVNQEYNYILTAIQQLKQLQQQFGNSKECLATFKPENKDKEILVPLTSTLYVPGKLCDPDHVTVDIGASYYADMTIRQAVEYLQRRVEYINKQIDKIAPSLEEKALTRQLISEVLQQKVQAAMAAQQGQKPKLGQVAEEADGVD